MEEGRPSASGVTGKTEDITLRLQVAGCIKDGWKTASLGRPPLCAYDDETPTPVKLHQTSDIKLNENRRAIEEAARFRSQATSHIKYS